MGDGQGGTDTAELDWDDTGDGPDHGALPFGDTPFGGAGLSSRGGGGPIVPGTCIYLYIYMIYMYVRNIK